MRQDFKLEPGDILINVNDRNDPFSRIKRWTIGPYEHVFLFLGKVKIIGYDAEIPLLFESMGRGCCLRSLSERYNQGVVVMRLKPQYKGKIPAVLEQAVKLASDPQAYYDYSIIALHIIPKVILEKLHLPISLKYQRDERMICSEAVFEVFYRGDLPILFDDIVPLPGDFVTDGLLVKEVWRGELSPEVI